VSGLGHPTTENLVRWVFDRLRPCFPLDMYLGVRIYESTTTYAEAGWA